MRLLRVAFVVRVTRFFAVPFLWYTFFAPLFSRLDSDHFASELAGGGGGRSDSSHVSGSIVIRNTWPGASNWFICFFWATEHVSGQDHVDANVGGCPGLHRKHCAGFLVAGLALVPQKRAEEGPFVYLARVLLGCPKHSGEQETLNPKPGLKAVGGGRRLPDMFLVTDLAKGVPVESRSGHVEGLF